MTEEKKETLEDIKEKPLLKKFTPEELKMKRVELDEYKLNILDKTRLIELIEREIADELPMRRKRIQLRKEKNDLERIKFDTETLERMIKQSQRS